MPLPTAVSRSRKALVVTAWVSMALMFAGVAGLVVCALVEGLADRWSTVALAVTLIGLFAPLVAGGIAAWIQRDVPEGTVVPDGKDLVLDEGLPRS